MGCVAVAIFVHSKKKHATDLKKKSEQSINRKTIRIEMNSKSTTNTSKGSTLTSKTVSVPSTTVYESIGHKKDSNIGEDDAEEEILKNVMVLPRKKKKRKKRKKKKRVNKIEIDAEEEVMVLTGPGSPDYCRTDRLENEFNKLTFDMDQVLKYGVTPMTNGGGKRVRRKTKMGDIVTKV